jgi:biopolymer transport protein ExbB/TolQ
MLALVWGVLGQVIGLFSAFQAIEMAGEVSQGILAGGLKISSYTTLYGLLVFFVAKLIKLIALSTTKE